MAISADTFALPEGADRIQAQRAEYVDRLVFKGKTEKYERKDERLGSAEALFVGEAFDGIARAIDESALNDAEKLYLWEQLRAFPPMYRFADVGRTNPQTHYWEVTSRQVEIQLNPALRAALKKDTALLSKILSADSRAQIMSAELLGPSSELSNRAGEMVLIHALISNGAGVNGEPIDFTKDPIVITSKVDDSAFALEEKTALATAAAASESRKQAVEEAREAPQVALRELKTAAMAHAKEALDAFNGAKGDATVALSTYREKLRKDRTDLDEQWATILETTKTQFATLAGEYGADRDITLIQTQLEKVPFVKWQFEDATKDAKQRLSRDTKASSLLSSIDDLLKASETNSRAIQVISEAERTLGNLGYAIQGDRERMKWWKDRREVTSTWDKPDLQRVDGFAQATDLFIGELPKDEATSRVSDAVAAMKTALTQKTAAEQAVRSIESDVEQLLLVVQGDRERMKWWKDRREVSSAWDKPDVATSDGFNTAIKERLSSLEAIQDIPEVAPAVAAVRQFGEILSQKDHALQEVRSADSQLHSTLHGLRRAVYLEAIKNGIPANSLVLQAVQLLREIDHVRLGTSAKKDYAQDQVFHLEPAKDGRYDFSMADFGHIDAEGNLQCEGVDPGVAAGLRRQLASHLNDYNPDADRAPLAVDEVVHAARRAIGGAREEADKARTEFHSLRSDYSDLGSEALGMAAQEDRLRTDLSDVRAELSRVSEAAAQAAKSHEGQIASLQGEERRLRAEKARETARAERAENRVQSLLAAIETLRAELDAANSKLLGAAGARQKAWDSFDRKTKDSE